MTLVEQLQRKVKILSEALKISRTLTDELKQTVKDLMKANASLQEALRNSLNDMGGEEKLGR